ncbi:hypothetical protein EG68_00355 [Paragonimus skrjabini miyazakii]|uniref:Uncharacterized protein n=1 Tax=Paragonimus skrjabini miyazakii TaxID=59628 RepID=A0A8S9Z9B7_9TREM|nr:hypothetical protein EG68_00355 [Paragonimus skrjabini miyazakii]
MCSRFVGTGWLIFVQLILYATASVVRQIDPKGYVHTWNEKNVKALHPVPEREDITADEIILDYFVFISELNSPPQVEGRSENLLKNELNEINHPFQELKIPSQPPPVVTLKPDSPPFPYLTTEDDVRKFPLVPRDETKHLIHAIRLLTTNARNFLGSFETINERNYRAVTEFLKRHAGSNLQTSDYGAMLQSWRQVAIGSEELTEQFLRKLFLLASKNQNSSFLFCLYSIQAIEYKTVILLNVKTYIQAYIASVVKRQNLMMDTAFNMVNQPSLSKSEFTLLENLLNFHQQVHTHSFRTMNTYIELLNRLANIKT